MTPDFADTQLAQARGLLALLEQEAQVLRSGDGIALKALCADKLGCLRQLETLLPLLRAPGASPLDGERRRSLLELLQQCRQQSQLNETLLNSRMNRARGALRARHGAPAAYDARGDGRYEAQRTLRSIA